MKPENLTPKGIFEDVISLTWTLNFYLDKGKDYEPLIKFLIEKRFDNIDELPSIKDLVKETGLSYPILSKYLKGLYKDLREDEEFIMDDHKVKYRIWVRHSYKNSVVFDLKNLPVVPRVGEKVDLSYFRECCGTNDFYVKKIRHKFQNGYQIVEIELDKGDYNLFWHYRLDEASERMEIHWRELLESSDSQLKEKLGAIPQWYRNL